MLPPITGHCSAAEPLLSSCGAATVGRGPSGGWATAAVAKASKVPLVIKLVKRLLVFMSHPTIGAS
jgi:hypothetical protein